VITQSSSAAIAVVLTAATGGLIGLPSAAALVVGATVGTTSTSLLAVIGATSNARRVAVANVAIHLFSGAVGLALLPVLLWLVLPADPPAPQPVSPAFALAAFHTTFAILGVLLFWPLTGRMARLLERRFKTPAEALGRPVHLDSNVMFAPAVALDAFVLELQRMAELARTVVRRAITLSRDGSKADGERAALRALVEAVEHFVVALERDRVPQVVGVQLPLVLRISNYIDEAVSLIDEISLDQGPVRAVLAAPVGARVRAFLAELTEVLDGADATASDFAPAALEAQYHELYARWRALKSQLLQAGIDREVPLSQLNPAIEALRSRLRAVERCTRVAIRLSELGAAVTHFDGAADPTGDVQADLDADAVAREQPAQVFEALAGEDDNGTRDPTRGP
jgi:phosphate:Na+ symporter